MNSKAGITYVNYGRPGIDLNNQPNLKPDVRFVGKSAGDISGYSISGGGDINNDEYDDILIGARQASENGGEVDLVFGGLSLAQEIDLADADFSAKRIRNNI